MGLFDRFKTPKWQHEDSDVRLEAVKELDDQEILIELAKSDNSKYVRREAVKKVTDQNALCDIAKCDDDKVVRKNAANRITEPNLLLELTKSRDSSIKFDAIYKFIDCLAEQDNQDELIKIARNDENYAMRDYATEKITDQNALMELYKNHSSESVRKRALDNITDQKILLELYNENPRTEIIEKINDQEVLEDIALNSDNYSREAAISAFSEINSFEKLNNLTSSLYDVENYGAIIIDKTGNIKTGKENIFDNYKTTDSSNMHIEYPSDAILISIDFSDETGDLSNYFYKSIITGHGLGDLEIKRGYLFENLKFIIAQGVTDKVTNIDGMFNGCPNLVDIKGLETWDVGGLHDKTYFNKIREKY